MIKPVTGEWRVKAILPYLEVPTLHVSKRCTEHSEKRSVNDETNSFLAGRQNDRRVASSKVSRIRVVLRLHSELG